ncbi:hypothetical protein [Streptomyces sp. KL116D]|uniref:hypothetical protein n=1 Tax=Streptomyces sp. KL116D TaxID=3045152 RepID=UPI0035574DBB
MNGRTTPSREMVRSLAQALGARPTDLIHWEKAWDRADADQRSIQLRRETEKSLRQRLTRTAP